MWATLALTAALSLAPAQEGLELKNDRATYGVLGPERKDDNVLPGDIYVVYFEIVGLQMDKTDRVKYSMGVEYLNKKGESQYKKEPTPQEAVNVLGGNRIPAFATTQIGLDTPPGEYTLNVTVTDQATKKEAKLTRKFTILEKRFGLVRVGFSYPFNFENPPPAPPLGVVGQSLLFHATAVEVGLSGDKKQPDLVALCVVTDESGKPTLSEPMQGKVQEVQDQFLKLRVIPLSFIISLNRPGKFKVTMTVTDNVTGKKTEQTMELTSIEAK
jgi:hypothetical protein